MRKFRVRGSLGYYELNLYDLTDGGCLSGYQAQRGKTVYATKEFKEHYLFGACLSMSYNKSSELYGLVSRQSISGCSGRSLQRLVVQQGQQLKAQSQKQVHDLLSSRSSEDVDSCAVSKSNFKHIQAVELNQSRDNLNHSGLKSSVLEGLSQFEVCDFEDAAQSVYISNDDVCCKRQKASRKDTKSSENSPISKDFSIHKYPERKMLFHNMSHIQYLDQTYEYCGPRLSQMINPLKAILLDNKLQDKNWIFLVDGQRTINECIEKHFGQNRKIELILDWYHLQKKVQAQFSKGTYRTIEREKAMYEVKYLLWHGLVQQAKDYLTNLTDDLIKQADQIERLKQYLDRNSKYIKCYALRRELGLVNSSNRVEKTNHLIIAKRQKHKGISFTRTGSDALALMACIKRNGQLNQWLNQQTISFKLAA